MSATASLEREIALAAGFIAASQARVFRCRLRVRYRSGSMLRFFVQADGRIDLIGVHPNVLLLASGGVA